MLELNLKSVFCVVSIGLVWICFTLSLLLPQQIQLKIIIIIALLWLCVCIYLHHTHDKKQLANLYLYTSELSLELLTYPLWNFVISAQIQTFQNYAKMYSSLNGCGWFLTELSCRSGLECLCSG